MQSTTNEIMQNIVLLKNKLNDINSTSTAIMFMNYLLINSKGVRENQYYRTLLNGIQQFNREHSGFCEDLLMKPFCVANEKICIVPPIPPFYSAHEVGRLNPKISKKLGDYMEMNYEFITNFAIDCFSLRNEMSLTLFETIITIS